MPNPGGLLVGRFCAGGEWDVVNDVTWFRLPLVRWWLTCGKVVGTRSLGGVRRLDELAASIRNGSKCGNLAGRLFELEAPPLDDTLFEAVSSGGG